jgi:uncharacterized protein YhaN
MRLTSFTLEKYGNFASAKLALDPRPGCINLVLGPNGGGKTVLRQAFHNLLFGIQGQTPMAFQYGYQGMRLAAEGIDASGAPFGFGRRKGIGNTIVDAAGNSLDPTVVTRLIGEADEALFERLFALDSHLLRSGAEAILASGGDLADALFAAGSGIASLRRLREKFEAARDELAPCRQARSRPFDQAVDQLTGAYRELRGATVRPRDWQDLKVKVEFTRDRRASLTRQQAQIRADIERFQRVKRVRPWLDQRQDLKQRCEALADAPRLPADTEERWRKAQQGVEVAEREVTGAGDALRTLADALAGEQPDERLLQQAPVIEDIERAQNQIVADQRDLPRREAERRIAATTIDNALLALGLKTFDEIAPIIPNGPQIAAGRDLVKKHGVLTERRERTAAEATRHSLAINTAESELGHIGEPFDITDLAALVREARADGEPRRRLSTLQTKLAAEDARLNAALAKVPLWNKGLEALVALIPPSREMIDRAGTTLATSAKEVNEAQREVKRLHGERIEAAEARDATRHGRPVPDAAAVAAARSHRDHGWSLIRRSKFEVEQLEAEIATYAGSHGLVATYEDAISTADDVADRRDEESTRLAKIASLDRTIARLDAQIIAADERLAERRRLHEEALRNWKALARSLGFDDLPELIDLRDFLAAREVVLDARSAGEAAHQALALETTEQETMRLRFARLMPQDEPGSLPQALASAEQVIERSTERHQERKRIETELRTFRRLHRQAEDDEDAARRALEAWQDSWLESLKKLSRPAIETPAGLEKAIELIEEAHREHQRLLDLDHRIAGMRGNIASFGSKVTKLISEVALDLDGQPIEAAAGALRRRLDANRAIKARRDQLLSQQKQAMLTNAQAEARRRQAVAEREGLREEIGGGSDEEIISRIEKATERARAEARLEECEHELAKISDGWAIPALEQEVCTVPAETVEPELARRQLDFDRLTTDREQAAVEERSLTDELRRIETGENALTAEESRQSAIASVTRISADALLYHAAACLVQAGLERLRGSGDEGLLGRIGTVFARITGGAYSGILADEDDKGTPYLIAIEADGTTTKRVQHLSEGTRDQLFLALRIVMLEDYAANAPALPFIADDLLQTFDDYGRTANALTALVDLSRHVQVILLSHHRQLIEVARTLPADTVHFCELPAVDAGLAGAML